MPLPLGQHFQHRLASSAARLLHSGKALEPPPLLEVDVSQEVKVESYPEA